MLMLPHVTAYEPCHAADTLRHCRYAAMRCYADITPAIAAADTYAIYEPPATPHCAIDTLRHADMLILDTP